MYNIIAVSRNAPRLGDWRQVAQVRPLGPGRPGARPPGLQQLGLPARLQEAPRPLLQVRTLATLPHFSCLTCSGEN